MTDARLIAFAERVSALRAQHKADMQVLRDEIAQTGKHDVAAVMRLAAWMDPSPIPAMTATAKNTDFDVTK